MPMKNAALNLQLRSFSMLITPLHSFFTVASASHRMVRAELTTDRVRSCGKYLCVGHRFQTLVNGLKNEVPGRD